MLTAAVETIARTGLAGTSVRDIARQARIRVSTLYHYYPSKEALYHAVQERVHGQIRELVVAALGRGRDFKETVATAVGELFDFFLRNRAYVQLGYRMALEGRPGTLADDRISERWLGLLEGTLRPPQVRGEVKNVDPVLQMLSIDALVHWHIVADGLYKRMLGKGLDDPELARQVREHVTQVALRTLGLD
ncbi:MAG: TetR/AcrR family transcriptional regulator [Candidatus Binatia bacterium]